jgi:hypothetical protein
MLSVTRPSTASIHKLVRTELPSLLAAIFSAQLKSQRIERLAASKVLLCSMPAKDAVGGVSIGSGVIDLSCHDP